jgi:hypothetical protein
MPKKRVKTNKRKRLTAGLSFSADSREKDVQCMNRAQEVDVPLTVTLIVPVLSSSLHLSSLV